MITLQTLFSIVLSFRKGIKVFVVIVLLVLPSLMNYTAFAQPETIAVFSWSFKGVSYGPWRVEVPKQLYDQYSSLSAESLWDTHNVLLSNEQQIWDYKYFSTWQDEWIREFVSVVNASQSEYSYYDRAGFVLAFVQSVPYTTNKERPRFPIETLVDGGVCSDKSVLYATLMMVLGYDVVFLHFPGEGTIPDHLAVGVQGGDYPGGTSYPFNGKKYYYCETSTTSWSFGQMPDKVKNDYLGGSAVILDAYCSQPIPEFSLDRGPLLAALVLLTIISFVFFRRRIVKQ
jgi:hypothetical protein